MIPFEIPADADGYEEDQVCIESDNALIQAKSWASVAARLCEDDCADDFFDALVHEVVVFQAKHHADNEWIQALIARSYAKD